MKTFIRFFKDHGKNIVIRDCQMHYKKYLRRKEIRLMFSIHFVERHAKIFTDQPLLDYFWDISIHRPNYLE